MANDKWTTYEANLQSYRSAFLSSQSIMLAVGAIIINKGLIPILIIAFIAIFQIVYVWIPVIRYRALLVDFHKYNMGAKFDYEGNFVKKADKPLTELIYCKNKKVRKRVNCGMYLEVTKERPFSNWRESRKKIDVIIPGSMIVIWILFICVSFME